VPVESKQTACETCVARKKKCTHGLGGPKEAEIKREPDLATFQKPACGKTKRVQEEKFTSNKVSKKSASGGKTKHVQEEKPTSNKVSKKSASGGKTKHVQEEKPTSNKVSKEPALGGKSAVDEEQFPFGEELDLNLWDDALAQQYYDEEMAAEDAINNKGLRDLLALDSDDPDDLR
jgi:copper chaperone CopZ